MTDTMFYLNNFSDHEIQANINDLQSRAAVGLPGFNHQDAEEGDSLYHFIERHSLENHMLNTAAVLPLVRKTLFEADMENFEQRKETADGFLHALAVARLLLDMNMPLSTEEKDVILAAASAHTVLENKYISDEAKRDLRSEAMDERIYTALNLLDSRGIRTDKDKKDYFDRIARNKYAMLVKLAEQGNVVERLYQVSTWDARECVRETKEYYFPVCIYAKDNYPELFEVVSVMMEKMRNLIDLADILASRFQEREAALMTEILSLREENSRIRRIITKLQKEKLHKQSKE